MVKVLVFCPTYKRGGLDQFWPDSRASFDALIAPDGVEVVREIGTDNPWDHRYHRYRNTLHQFQQARQHALDGGYDALVQFESDMIVPADGLVKLWETPAPVVYGLYVLRHGSNVVNAFRHLRGSPNIDQSLSLFPDEYEKAVKAGAYLVSGCGSGFTLIRREVLERFEFRAWDDGISYAPDWAFATDCQRAGVLQMARFDVQCGHIEDDGNILWPGTQPMIKKRVKVLADFTGHDGNDTRRFTAGTVDEIAGTMTDDFIRAGYISVIDDGVLPIQAKPRVRWAYGDH